MVYHNHENDEHVYVIKTRIRRPADVTETLGRYFACFTLQHIISKAGVAVRAHHCLRFRVRVMIRFNGQNLGLGLGFIVGFGVRIDG